MNKSPLGNLEPVDLRDVFPSESSDFTPWLAQNENLAKLGTTLDIELELEYEKSKDKLLETKGQLNGKIESHEEEIES